MTATRNTVKMLTTTLGVDEGQIYPTPYEQGKTYEIGSSLLNAFIEMGVVELTDGKKKSPAENKAHKDAPENKEAPAEIEADEEREAMIAELEAMDEEQLRDYAESAGVKLGKKDKKPAILKALLAALDNQ